MRAEAKKLGDTRHKLFEQSQAAYRSNNKKAAHDLSVKAKALTPKIDTLNAKCVEAIMAPQDTSSGSVDLHGLFVMEAMTVVKKFVEDFMKSKKYSHLVIVTGAGHHSKQHDHPVIR